MEHIFKYKFDNNTFIDGKFIISKVDKLVNITCASDTYVTLTNFKEPSNITIDNKLPEEFRPAFTIGVFINITDGTNMMGMLLINPDGSIMITRDVHYNGFYHSIRGFLPWTISYSV